MTTKFIKEFIWKHFFCIIILPGYFFTVFLTIGLFCINDYIGFTEENLLNEESIKSVINIAFLTASCTMLTPIIMWLKKQKLNN